MLNDSEMRKKLSRAVAASVVDAAIACTVASDLLEGKAAGVVDALASARERDNGVRVSVGVRVRVRIDVRVMMRF